jgi:hypothetical protein
VNALAAHPVGRLLAEGAEEAGKCHGRSCGGIAVFGVALMFLVLCGGVWLLLQSSFGPLQAYLVSGAAFWGCWFVLAIIWFTGVPGIPIHYIPGISKDIPRSTPRYYGPQGDLPKWDPVSGSAADRSDWIDSEGTQRPSDVEQIKSAETAATGIIANHYAAALKVDAKKIAVPQIAEITKREIARTGGDIGFIRLTVGPAKGGASATAEQQDLIKKIQPATFVLKFDPGTTELPTLIALPFTFGLFAIHMFGLIWYERRHRPAPVAARERERATAGVA